MGIIICILIIFLIGFSAQKLLLNEDEYSNTSRLGVSFGVGSSFVCIQMLILNFLEIKWSFLTVFVPWVLFICFVFLRKKRLMQFPRIKKIPPISYFLILLIILLTIFTLGETMLRPVSAWDAIASWYMGGKAFFLDGEILPSYYIYVNYDYPPFMHFLLAATNFLNTRFNDTFSLLLFFSFFPFLLLTIYSMLRKHMSFNMSLLLTFLFASTQNLLRHAGKYDIGNADLPLSYFMLVSLFFILKFSEKKSIKVLFIALTTLTTSALIKNDGVPYFLIGYVILFFLWGRSSKKNLAIFLFPLGLLPFVYWKIFVVLNNLPLSYINFLNFHIERTPTIIWGILRELLNIARWNFIWIFIALGIYESRKFKKLSIISLLFLSQLASYVYVYFVTPIEVSSHISNSFDRLLIQILPLAFLLASISLFHKDKNALQ